MLSSLRSQLEQKSEELKSTSFTISTLLLLNHVLDLDDKIIEGMTEQHHLVDGYDPEAGLEQAKEQRNDAME